jgi:hypothetical protein
VTEAGGHQEASTGDSSEAEANLVKGVEDISEEVVFSAETSTPREDPIAPTN